MLQGMMPEDLENNASVNNSCSQQSYAGLSVCYYDMTGRAYLASPHLNKMYYNPNITYPVPVAGDGTSFGPASFTAARVDGYSSTSATVNLSNDYRAIMAAGSVGTGAITTFAISPNAAGSQAFTVIPVTPSSTLILRRNSKILPIGFLITGPAYLRQKQGLAVPSINKALRCGSVMVRSIEWVPELGYASLVASIGWHFLTGFILCPLIQAVPLFGVH